MYINKHLSYELSDVERESLETVRRMLISMDEAGIDIDDITAWKELDTCDQIADFLDDIIDQEGSDL